MSAMRVRTLIVASSLALLAALGAASGCGGNVVTETGGTGTTSGTGTSTGTGGGDTFGACNGPGQCELATVGCCPACGNPTITTFEAVNSSEAAAFQKYTCPAPQPCPNCASFVDPNFYAYCDAGHCTVGDIRTDPVSACSSDADCVLRQGSACCEGCGDGSELVAVSVNGGFSSLVCPPNVDCPGCIPTPPTSAFAACVGGHCAVELTGAGN